MPPVRVVFSGGSTAPCAFATLIRMGMAMKNPPIMISALIASEYATDTSPPPTVMTTIIVVQMTSASPREISTPLEEHSSTRMFAAAFS